MPQPIELQESFYGDLEEWINQYKKANKIEQQAYLYASKLRIETLGLRYQTDTKKNLNALAKEMYFIYCADLISKGEPINAMPKFENLLEVLSKVSIYTSDAIDGENCIVSIRNNLQQLESNTFTYDKKWIDSISQIAIEKIQTVQETNLNALNAQKPTQEQIWDMVANSLSNLILKLPPSIQGNVQTQLTEQITLIKNDLPKNEGDVNAKLIQIETGLNKLVAKEIKNDKIKLGFKFAALSLCIIGIATALSGVGLIIAGAICYKHWDSKVKEYAKLNARFLEGLYPLMGHTAQFFKPPKPVDTENVPVSIPQNVSKS